MRFLPPAHSPVSTASILGALGGWLRGRPADIEDWLARYFEVDAALLLDSGTSALRLAIQSLAPSASVRVRVALPAYGCYDLATAALGADAVVSFYDVDSATLGPDWVSLGAVLSAGVDCLVLVHQYGIPVDVDRARALADAHGVLVVEDAAQGAGGWWRHRRLGAWGDLGVLSFGRGKGMTAGGGGALLANGARGRALLEGSRAMVPSGGRGASCLFRLGGQAVLSHPLLYGLPARMPWLALGDTPFHEPWDPRGIAAAQAGVLHSAAMLADIEADIRRARALQLAAPMEGRAGLTTIHPPVSDGTRSGWLRFPVLVDREVRGRALALGRRLGIAPGYPLPLPDLPSFPGPHTVALPGATALSTRLVTLPTHRFVRDADHAALEGILLR